MKRTRRFLALLLTCAMLLSVGIGAWAAELTPEIPPEMEDPTALSPEEALAPEQAELATATNIARGKTITAKDKDGADDSENPSTEGPEKMVDGNDDTRWASEADMKATGANGAEANPLQPKTVVIDLGAGKAATVENIVIKWYLKVWAREYTISTAATNTASTTWTQVYSCTRNSQDNNNVTDTIAVGTNGLSQNTLQRYVRFVFNKINLTAGGSGVSIKEIQINGELTDAPDPNALPDSTNLCRPGDGATVAASASEYEAGTTYDSSKAIDGDKSTHWGTSADAATPWLVVDLGTVRNVSSVKAYWECLTTESTSPASGYKIYASQTVSSGTGDWGEAVYTSTESPAANHSGSSAPAVTASFTATQARYIKLQVTGYRSDTGWANVGIHELEVYGTGNTRVAGSTTPTDPTDDTPDGNLCRLSGVTATASSEEANSVRASNAIDGNSTGSNSRWGSAVGNGPHWLQIDLGTTRTVSLVKIFWERRNVLAYELKGSTDGNTWQDLHTCTSEITTCNEALTFNPVSIRYLKLNISRHKATGIKVDGTESQEWNTVSLFEVEAYKSASSIPVTASSILADLGSAPLTVSSGHVVFTDAAQAIVDAQEDAYDITFAADYEQLVGADGTVYQPLVNTTARFDITVQNKTDASDKAASSAASPIALSIPGAHAENEGNPKPAVIPELMEWYSSSAQNNQKFTLTASSRIVAPSTLTSVANELKADVKDLFGYELNVVTSGAQAGDIVLTLGTGAAVAGFDDETYIMDVTDKVTITAKASTGVYWGTRSALQALKLSGDKTIDQGKAKDYPKFRLRGFMLDVGRKPMSMDMVREFARNMAWYKMNDFHIHLSDNLIFMEDYLQNDSIHDADEAYSAFRMESSLQSEEGAKPLTATDYAYTKQEFKNFADDAADIGVTVVPEFDVPAHAKAITDAFPSVQLESSNGRRSWIDHLDLVNEYDQSLTVVKNIYNDYIDNDIFTSGTVHFGADEFYSSEAALRNFTNDMIAYLHEKGVTPRVWGSIGNQPSATDNGITGTIDPQVVREAGAEMDIWAPGNGAAAANPQTAYDLGFNVINISGGSVYLVPDGFGEGDRTGYGDYLNTSSLYSSWTPNNLGGTWLPASSPQMAGGSYAMWQDNIDTKVTGIDEVDSFVRFYDALPTIAVKTWGDGNDGLDREFRAMETDAATIGCAPQSNPFYEIDLPLGQTTYASFDFSDQPNKELTVGTNTCVETGLDYDKLPWDSQLSFWVKVEAPGVIFETDHLSTGKDQPYNEYAIKALATDDPAVWHLGFSRELYDYEFDADLPMNTWVKLKLVSSQENTELFEGDSTESAALTGSFTNKGEKSNTLFMGRSFTVGESLTASVGRGKGIASLNIPVARFGSATTGNSFVGALDNVVLAPSGTSTASPVDSGAYDIPTSQYTVSDGSHQTGNEADKAIDGDAATVWHTQWRTDSITPGNAWIQFTLPQVTAVNAVRYLRSSGGNGVIQNYDILVSENGTTWTKIHSGTFDSTNDWQTASFPTQNTRYIRFQAKSSLGDPVNNFAAAAEMRVCRAINLQSDGATASFAEESYPLVGGSATPDPIVVLDGAVLTKGTDYTVTYSNNTAQGTGTATITGTGAYTGTITATFTIQGAEILPDLADATVTLPQTAYAHTGSAIEPVPTVTLDGVTLAAGKDYTVSYANNTNVGTSATVTVTGTGDYTGSKTVSFEIVAAASQTIDLSGATVTLPQTSYTHTGSAITPVPTVTLNGDTLTQGTDYTVGYASNVAVGTATVTITGILNYTGTATATFQITEATGTEIDLSTATVTLPKSSYTHTGSAITPEPTVKLNGASLTKGTDYTVSYANNVNVGTATVTVTGMGNYTGTASATFKITSSGGNTPGGGTPSGPKPSGSTPIGGSPTPSLPTEPVTTTVTDPVSGATTEKTVNPDGSTYEKVTLKNGAVTETTVEADGTKTQRVEAATGSVMKTVTEPSGRTIQALDAPNRGLTITVTDPLGEVDVAVSIPDVPQETIAANQYVDVPQGHWSAAAVSTVSSLGLFKGDDTGHFQGEVPMSRGMVATVLHRLSGEVSKMPVGFADVADSAYYASALDWAASIQVIQGVGQGKCDPDRAVTRQELCAMLYRYTQFIDSEGKAIAHGSIGDFEDSGEVSGWATNAMDWAITNGLINGRGGNLLAPNAPASRAEVAAIFTRLVELIQP